MVVSCQQLSHKLNFYRVKGSPIDYQFPNRQDTASASKRPFFQNCIDGVRSATKYSLGTFPVPPSHQRPTLHCQMFPFLKKTASYAQQLQKRLMQIPNRRTRGNHTFAPAPILASGHRCTLTQGVSWLTIPSKHTSFKLFVVHNECPDIGFQP